MFNYDAQDTEVDDPESGVSSYVMYGNKIMGWRRGNVHRYYTTSACYSISCVTSALFTLTAFLMAHGGSGFLALFTAVCPVALARKERAETAAASATSAKERGVMRARATKRTTFVNYDSRHGTQCFALKVTAI